MPPWHIDKTVGIQHYKDDRSLSQKEIDTIVEWVAAGSPKGDPKDMPAPIKWADGNDWNYAKQFGGPPDLDHQVAQVHAEGRRDGRVVQARRRDAADRAALGSRHRDAPGTLKGRKITHHALAYLMQDEKEAQALLISADADSGAGLFMEWAVNKQGEMMRAQHRQADAARLEDPLGHPLQRRRRRHQGPGRARHLLLSEGPGAEVPHRAVALQRRHRRQPQPRHRAELDQRRPELPRDAQRRPRRELPAAHAPSRQGDDGRSHPAQRPAAGARLRRRTSSSTG